MQSGQGLRLFVCGQNACSAHQSDRLSFLDRDSELQTGIDLREMRVAGYESALVFDPDLAAMQLVDRLSADEIFLLRTVGQKSLFLVAQLLVGTIDAHDKPRRNRSDYGIRRQRSSDQPVEEIKPPMHAEPVIPDRPGQVFSR